MISGPTLRGALCRPRTSDMDLAAQPELQPLMSTVLSVLACAHSLLETALRVFLVSFDVVTSPNVIVGVLHSGAVRLKAMAFREDDVS